MTQQRLPYVNGDDGDWGDILNQFLEKEHYNTALDDADNGGHQKVTIRPGTAAAGTAPLKIMPGTLMTNPETGAIEADTDYLYHTAGLLTPTRKIIAAYNTSGSQGEILFVDNGLNTGVVRLPLGNPGQLLRVGSTPYTPLEWVNANNFNSATKNVNYTLTGTDVIVLADASSGNVTISLPNAFVFYGYRFFVKRIDNSANICEINCANPLETIDGNSSVLLKVQYISMTLFSNGSAWYII